MAQFLDKRVSACRQSRAMPIVKELKMYADMAQFLDKCVSACRQSRATKSQLCQLVVVDIFVPIWLNWQSS